MTRKTTSLICLTILGISGCGQSVPSTPDVAENPEPDIIEPTVKAPEAGTGERVEFEILEALGQSNRGVERIVSLKVDSGIVELKFAANQNMSGSLIKAGIRRDVRNALKAVVDSRYRFEAVGITGVFPIDGVETNAILAVVTRESAAGIHWPKFTPDDVEGVSQRWWIHPRIK